jgi:hypothetical protein
VCIGLSVVATVAAQLVAYPMYTVKSCLQSGMPHPGATVMQCTTAILKERGALGTFEQLHINVITYAHDCHPDLPGLLCLIVLCLIVLSLIQYNINTT